MTKKWVLLTAASALALTAGAGAALAQGYYDEDYFGGYDDQAEETRRLNLMQLENPGAGLDAVPPPGEGYAGTGFSGGMGGPELSGPPSRSIDGDSDEDDDGLLDADDDNDGVLDADDPQDDDDDE